MTDLFSRSCWHSCRRLQWLRRSLRRAPQAVIAVGMQAAALVIAKPLAGAAGFSDRAVDLRVDDHRTPIPELRRVYNVLRSNQILTEAMVAFRDSRPDEALRIALTARDLSPENDNVWVGLAHLYMAMDRKGECFDALRRAVESNPANKSQLPHNPTFEPIRSDP